MLLANVEILSNLRERDFRTIAVLVFTGNLFIHIGDPDKIGDIRQHVYSAPVQKDLRPDGTFWRWPEEAADLDASIPSNFDQEARYVITLTTDTIAEEEFTDGTTR